MINLEKEIREQPSVLRSIEEKNKDTIRALVADIKSRNITNVYFAARGTSDHACIYAQYLYGIHLGIPSGLATSSVISKYECSLKLENALVIGVSQSGAAEDVLCVLKNGNACNTITVAITNNADSIMAKEAKYTLLCNAGPEYSIAATKTFTSQMYVLALLCAEWSGNEKLLCALRKVPDAVEEMLNYVPEKIEEYIQRYRYLSAATVLGRGFMYPIALEGALKVLETNQVKMKGYPISDFYHGPLAQIHPTDLVFLLAAEGPTLDDATAMLEKLESIDAEVFLITDNAELIKDRKIAIKLPELGCDCVSPFLFAVTMQLIALKLTEVKGLNPDKSEVLNKVTVTK